MARSKVQTLETKLAALTARCSVIRQGGFASLATTERNRYYDLDEERLRTKDALEAAVELQARRPVLESMPFRTLVAALERAVRDEERAENEEDADQTHALLRLTRKVLMERVTTLCERAA